MKHIIAYTVLSVSILLLGFTVYFNGQMSTVREIQSTFNYIDALRVYTQRTDTLELIIKKEFPQYVQAPVQPAPAEVTPAK